MTGRNPMHDGITAKQAANERIESAHHATGHHGFMHNGNVGMGKALKMAHHSTGANGFTDSEDAGSDTNVQDDAK